MDLGATCFDHADVHIGGRCEETFADAIGMMRPAVRDRITLQSKVGIRPGVAFDSPSSTSLRRAGDGILRRLRTDRLDDACATPTWCRQRDRESRRPRAI